MQPRRISATNKVRGKLHPTFYTKGTNGELITHTSPLKPEVQQAKQIIPQNAPELMGKFNKSGKYIPPNLKLPMYRPNGTKLSSKNRQNVKNAYTGNPSTIFPIRVKRQSINRSTRTINRPTRTINRSTLKKNSNPLGTSFG